MEYPSLDKPKAGALRFNTDSSQLEIYDGNQWTGVLSNSDVNSSRAVWGNGASSGNINTLEFVQINSTGNTTDFGDSSWGRDWCTGSASNGQRGLWI